MQFRVFQGCFSKKNVLPELANSKHSGFEQFDLIGLTLTSSSGRRRKRKVRETKNSEEMKPSGY
jgi:hypothetical protein